MSGKKQRPPSKYQRLRQQLDERDRRHSWEIRRLQYEMRERFEAETRYLRQQNEALMEKIATILGLSPPDYWLGQKEVRHLYREPLDKAGLPAPNA